MKRDWYAIFDCEPEGKAYYIKSSEAEHWNKRGYGIFWTVNEFSGGRRQENLVRINAWAVDMDWGTKQEQQAIIRSALPPSLIIETAKGYHVYYNAIGGKVENFREIMWCRLVPFFKADPRAKDLSRVLRVPGFYHCKNPVQKFLIKQILHKPERNYHEEDMLKAFPKLVEDPVIKPVIRKEPTEGTDFWERVYNLDAIDALERLSGTTHVNFEQFSFKQTTRGKFNILVNGKSTSCWIDENRHIGSLNGGGPSIAQWLKYYSHSYSDILRIIKEVFPEVNT